MISELRSKKSLVKSNTFTKRGKTSKGNSEKVMKEYHHRQRYKRSVVESAQL